MALVILVDDDQDLLDSLAEIVQSTGKHECALFRGLADLVSHPENVSRGALAIVDVNLGAHRPSGVEVYRWLREHGYRGRVIFLTGHARALPQVAQALKIGDAEVREKPIGFDELVEISREVNG